MTIPPSSPEDTPPPLGAAATPGGLRVVAPPRMTDDLFIDVLTRAQSPAAPGAASLYAICVSYGIDPAVALAFFQHESSYGTKGKAVTTRNWGNLRRGPRAVKIAPVGQSGGPFAWYDSWAEGLRDFCSLLRGPLYEGAGLVTVDQIVPKYAPPADGNSPRSYIAAVERAVAGWAAADPWASWGNQHPLDPAARGWSIPRRWLGAQPPLGPALGPEQTLSEGRAAQSFQGGIIVWLGGERTVIVRDHEGQGGEA